MYTYNDINLPSTIEEQEKFFAMIGFAKNGPVNTAFTIKDTANPYEILGNCPLADAYTAVKVQGVTPLILRLNGSHASYQFTVNGEVALRVTSIEANDESNNIRLQVYPTHLRIIGLRTDRVYLFADYPHVFELVEAINFDARYGLGEVDAVSLVDMIQTNTLTTTAYEVFLEDGDDGSNLISNNDGSDTPELYAKQMELVKSMILDGDTSMGELTPYNIDTVIIPDMAFENHIEVAPTLGKFAYSKTEEQTSFCSVVLGSWFFSEENSETYNYDEKMDMLIDLGNATATDEYFTHIEVVLGVEDADNDINKQPVSSRFAAMRFKLEPHLSATNKKIEEINTLFTRLSKEDIALLTSNGYTCIVPSIRRGHVAFKSTSFIANQNLISSKPHYSRCIRYYANYLVEALDSQIGKPTSQFQVTTLSKAVGDRVKEVLELDIFKNITYDVRLVDYDEIRVTLTFLPYGEIESVQSQASYDPGRKTVITWM